MLRAAVVNPCPSIHDRGRRAARGRKPPTGVATRMSLTHEGRAAKCSAVGAI